MTFDRIDKLRGAENFDTWSFITKLVLAAEGYKNCIEIDDTGVVLEKDDAILSRAHEILFDCVEPEIHPRIQSCKSAMEIWTKLHGIFEGKGLCRQISLLQELPKMKLEHYDSMQTYIGNMMALTYKMIRAGITIDDKLRAAFLLMGLSRKYSIFIAFIDDKKLTTKDIIPKLLDEAEKYEYISPSKIALKTKKCFICGSFKHLKKQCYKQL